MNFTSEGDKMQRIKKTMLFWVMICDGHSKGVRRYSEPITVSVAVGNRNASRRNTTAQGLEIWEGVGK